MRLALDRADESWPGSIASRLQLVQVLVEADVYPGGRVRAELTQRFELAYPQQGRVARVDGGGLGLDPQRRGVSLGPDALHCCLALRGHPFHLGPGPGLDRLAFGLGPSLHQLRLAQPLGGQHPVHDLLQVTGEDQVLDVGPQDLDAVACGGIGDSAEDVLAELIAAGQDLLQRHRRQRPASRQLNVTVEAVLIRHDLLHGSDRVDHLELGEDAHPDRDLVGRQDLLTLDCQLAFPHVDNHDLHRRAAPAKPAWTALWHVIPARLQHDRQPAVLVPQPTVRRLDDDVLRHVIPPSGGAAPEQARCGGRVAGWRRREQWMMLLVHGPLALLAPCPAGAALAPSLERPAPGMPVISRQPGSPAQTGSSQEMYRSVSNGEGSRAVMTARAVVFDIGGALALKLLRILAEVGDVPRGGCCHGNSRRRGRGRLLLGRPAWPFGVSTSVATLRPTRSRASAWRMTRVSALWPMVTAAVEHRAAIVVSAWWTSAAVSSRSLRAPIAVRLGGHLLMPVATRALERRSWRPTWVARQQTFGLNRLLGCVLAFRWSLVVCKNVCFGLGAVDACEG